MEYAAPQITGREEPFRSEIRERLWADYQEFASRDLGEYDVAYLFIDGVAERIRPGSRREPVLAAWGFTASGSKVLLHLMAGSKEDAGTVGAFFQDMRHRGLGDPLLVVSDGAPGIVKAIETCFPHSARQRCLAHRMRNLVAKVPDDVWPEFKGRVTAAYQAPSRAIARELAEGVVRDYAKELPSAVRCFEDDFEACIAHLRMPINHRRAIRTTNLLERLFLEERRRLKVLPHAFGERPVLKLHVRRHDPRQRTLARHLDHRLRATPDGCCPRRSRCRISQARRCRRRPCRLGSPRANIQQISDLYDGLAQSGQEVVGGGEFDDGSPAREGDWRQFSGISLSMARSTFCSVRTGAPRRVTASPSQRVPPAVAFAETRPRASPSIATTPATPRGMSRRDRPRSRAPAPVRPG